MLKDEKAEAAPINQLASAVGVLTDRFLKSDKDTEDNGKLNEILSVIKDE